MAGKVKSWSISSYHLYKQCPYKFKLLKIDKMKEPPSEAMERGNMLHGLCERYIKGILRTFPPQLKKLSAVLKLARKGFEAFPGESLVEQEMAFAKGWGPSDWKDWAGCWLRVKVDYAYMMDGTVLVMHDWKSGKFRDDDVPKYMEQLELYALAAFLRYPQIMEVRASLQYIDLGQAYPVKEPKVFKRESLKALQKAWEERVKPMFADEAFAPSPNRFCPWCHFSARNNGPCKF